MSIINKIIKVNALLVVYITKCLKICSTSRMIGTKRLTMISKCTSHTQNTACRPHVSLETNWCGPQEELRIVKKKKKLCSVTDHIMKNSGLWMYGFIQPIF